MDIADDRKKSGEVKGLTSTGNAAHSPTLHHSLTFHHMLCMLFFNYPETLVYGEVTFPFMYAMLTDPRLELPSEGGHFVDLGMARYQFIQL
jgi:hypothetical protein